MAPCPPRPATEYNPKAILLESPALRMLQSIIRDKNTTQKEYVMASDRLVNILVEEGVRRVLPDCKTAKILIQRDEETAKPKFFYAKLPPNIDTMQVVLCDPMLA